jgi:hypothetical protein
MVFSSRCIVKTEAIHGTKRNSFEDPPIEHDRRDPDFKTLRKRLEKYQAVEVSTTAPMGVLSP